MCDANQNYPGDLAEQLGWDALFANTIGFAGIQTHTDH